MKRKSRLLGWLSLGSAVVWIWYDFERNFKKAVLWGYFTLAFAVAHIWAAKQ